MLRTNVSVATWGSKRMIKESNCRTTSSGQERTTRFMRQRGRDRFHHSLSRLTGEQFRFAIARAAIAKRTCSLHSDGCFEESRQFGRRSGQHKGRTDPYRYANDGAGIRVWVLQYRSDCPQLDGQIFKNVKVPRARLGRKGTHKMGLPIAVAFGDFLLHAAVE